MKGTPKLEGLLCLRAPRSKPEWTDYFNLRWRVLRAPHGQPRGSERDVLDDSGWHVAAFDRQGIIVGVGRLAIVGASVGQVGFMAVSDENRAKGVGTAIMRAILCRAEYEGLSSLRVKARDSACEFYQKFGFTVVGRGPVLFKTIRHRWMARDVTQNGRER